MDAASFALVMKGTTFAAVALTATLASHPRTREAARPRLLALAAVGGGLMVANAFLFTLQGAVLVPLAFLALCVGASRDAFATSAPGQAPAPAPEAVARAEGAAAPAAPVAAIRAASLGTSPARTGRPSPGEVSCLPAGPEAQRSS